MLESELFKGLPINEEVVERADYDEEKAVSVLLEFLTQKLDLFAASALFVDEENNLYSPIFVYPPERQKPKFVKMPYRQGQWQQFSDRREVFYIEDISNSSYYTSPDIAYSSTQKISLYSLPIRYFNLYQGVLNCYVEAGHSNPMLETIGKALIHLMAEKIAAVKYQCFDIRKKEFRDSGRRLAQFRNLLHILQRIITTCKNLKKEPLYGFIGIVDEKRKIVEILDAKHVLGLEEALPDCPLRKAMCFDIETGITGQVIKEKKPLLLHDVDDREYGYLNYSKSWRDVKSNLCFPIFLRTESRIRMLAVISLEATRHYVFSQSDIEVLRAYAGYAAIAIDTAKHYERYEDIQGFSIELGSLIADADLRIARGESERFLHDISEKVIEICRKLAEARHIFVATKSISGDKLEIQASTQDDLIYDTSAPIPIGQGLSGRAVLEKTPQRFDARAQREALGYFSVWREPIESELAIPVVHAGEAIGVINLESHTPEKFKTQELTAKIERLAGVVAAKVADARYDLYSREIYEKEYSIIVGKNEAIEKVKKEINQFARHDLPVLIYGESGTGKELVARRIHYESPRRNKRFTAIACTEIKQELIESELFGHVKGAYTGAESDRAGKLEYSEGGTVFLDELGDLPYPAQGKLLRILQEQEITPLGSNESRKIDIRIITATSKNLRKLVAENKFREDLFYRLSVLTIKIPPLRERREDIEALAEFFLTKHIHRLKLEHTPKLSKLACRELRHYNWPGNLRQLENVIQRAIILAEDSNSIKCEHIRFFEAIFAEAQASNSGKQDINKDDVIREIYNQRGIKKRAYAALDISRTKAERLVPPDALREHVRRAKSGLEWSPPEEN